MLWAIRDNGTEPEVLFKVPAPVSSLSLYDVSLGQQHVPSWDTGKAGFPHRRSPLSSLKHSTGIWEVKNIPASSSASTASGPVLWAASSLKIIGYNSRNGSVEYVIDVSKLLNVTCRLTSKVMVTRSKDGKSERLVFAVSEPGNTTKNERQGNTDLTKNARRGNTDLTKNERQGNTDLTKNDRQGNTSRPYVVAVSLDSESGHLRVLWKVANRPGTEVVGQIANVLVVPPTQRMNSRNNRHARKEDGNEGSGVHGREDDNNDEEEVLLVATAVSDTAQFSFAIGHQ